MWKTTYHIGTREFKTRQAAIKYAKEWLREEPYLDSITITVEKHKAPGVRGRVLGYSASNFKYGNDIVVKQYKSRRKNPTMKRKSNKLPEGKWVGVHAIRKRGNKVDIIVNPGRIKNVEMGFYDQHGFHPIRASKDYDPDRLFDSEYEPADRRRTRSRAKAKPKTKKRKR